MCLTQDNPLFEMHHLDQAKDWLCELRKHYSQNSDLWEVTRNWETIKHTILENLNTGEYEFAPLERYDLNHGVYLTLWTSKDMIALKMITQSLEHHMSDHLSNACYHVKGKGGLKHAVRQTHAASYQHTYVFRSDIKGYYDSIRFDVLIRIISDYVKHPTLLTLIEKALHRTETMGGLYYEYHQNGIPKGSPLSPLLGAIALLPLDQAMNNTPNIFYARYMDDWVVFTQSKTALRKVIRKTHTLLNELHLKLHPLKTYIGKIAHGFNFLGYFMDNRRILPSQETIRRFHERALVLYEHPTEPLKRLRHRSGRDISEYSVKEARPQEKEVRTILTSLNNRGDIRHKATRRLRRYIDQWTRWIRVGLTDTSGLTDSTQRDLPSLYAYWQRQHSW